MGQYSILIVDDEEYVINSIVRLLRYEGYIILSARDSSQALALLSKNRVDLVISDYKMPQMSGLELLIEVRRLYPETMRVILTGYADMKETIAAAERGDIHRFIEKPWHNEEFKVLIKELLKQKEQVKDGT